MKYNLGLSCLHTMVSSHAYEGLDAVTCPTCRQTSHVVARTNHKERYRLKCEDCTYGRLFGLVLYPAQTRAMEHGRRKRHRVIVYFNDEPKLTFDARAIEDTFDDLAPF